MGRNARRTLSYMGRAAGKHNTDEMEQPGRKQEPSHSAKQHVPSSSPGLPGPRDQSRFPPDLQERGAENFYAKCLRAPQTLQQESRQNSLLSLDCQRFFWAGGWWYCFDNKAC